MDRYSIIVQWNERDEVYVAQVPELPGLSAFGSTPEKAIHKLAAIQKDFVDTLIEAGESLPEPDVMKSYSGQLRIRIPKTLHASLSLEAKTEGVSLNTIIITHLAQRHAVSEMQRQGLASIKEELLSLMRQTSISPASAAEPTEEWSHTRCNPHLPDRSTKVTVN